MHGIYDNLLCTSDMQFGFKPQHATVLCSLIYKEILTNYLQHVSNVYSCLLDAPKSFGRVHYEKLFNVLIEKQMPFSISISFWIHIYSNE